MSLQDLTPVNSQRALETALNVFKRFLAAEDTTLEYVRATLVRDVKGLAFVKLMDRFAMHLAFSNGRGGQPLARNTIMSYYRSVKNWLLDDQPQHRQAVEKQLLKMGRTLERYCLKRSQGGMVNKAPACTKDDLRILIDGMHYDASTPRVYQDAALLAIMWYAFGRSSDLAFVKKCNLSVASDNVLFLRLIRAKTSEEQGLSLYPDQHSYVTCPLHAIGTALVMQHSPSDSLLQLPVLIDRVDQAAAPASSGLSLVEALERCYGDEGESSTATTATSSTLEKRQTSAPLKMQGYVNRVVKVASERQARANPTASLSSHSFRRGGAQYANRDASLSAQWIFDRGSWNMSATNKAFAYVVNTTSEDMKVSKVLSDWSSDDNPVIASFSAFDSTSHKKIDDVMRTLFSSSLGFEDRSLNVDRRVADLLCATLIRHFPEFSARHVASPYAARVRDCLAANNVPMSEMLAWSVHLGRQHGVMATQDTKEDVKFTKEEKLINHQNTIISELLSSNRKLYARLAALEHAQGSAAAVRNEQGQQQGAQASSGSEEKRGRALPMSASSMWFEWYTKVPRLWDVCESRQYKSTSKQVVAYMKLFLPRGFVLDPSSATYCDDVMRAGREAEENMIESLRSLGINRKFGSGLLKQLRQLHQQGQFDSKIREYLIRVRIGQIIDPAPKETQDTFSKICI